MESYRTQTVRMTRLLSQRTKEFMLRRIHADVFIDDNWQYIQEVALLFLFSLVQTCCKEGNSLRRVSLEYGCRQTRWRRFRSVSLVERSRSLANEGILRFPCFLTNKPMTTILSLQGELLHGKSTLLLLLTQGLLGGLSMRLSIHTHLLLGQGTTHRTGLLDAEISRHVLGIGEVLLQLHVSLYSHSKQQLSSGG